jgi:hypothetical protein
MPKGDNGLKFKNANTEGQGKRINNEIAIEEALKKYCPKEYDDLVACLSYEMHLCPDTIKYSFLKVYFGIGFIRYDAKTRIVSLTDSEANTVITKCKNEETNKCRNCGKPIPDTITHCSKDCLEISKTKEEGKTN